MFKNLLLLGAAVIGVVALAKYRLARAIDIVIYKLKFTGTLQEPKLILGIELNNPTPYWADVQSVNGKIYANGSLLGIIDQQLDLRIAKETKSTTDIIIKIFPIAAVTNIIKYFTSFGGYDIKIDAVIKVDGVNIPFYYEYK